MVKHCISYSKFYLHALDSFRLMGCMLVLLKSIEALLLAPTELGFYIILLAGPLLGLKSDL